MIGEVNPLRDFMKFRFLLVYVAFFNTLLPSVALYGEQPARVAGSVTNPTRSDGFGSQFFTLILAAAQAELHHKPFYYTPFSKMEHNYDGDPQFLKKKEELINFIGNFPLNEDNQAEEPAVGSLIFNFEHYVESFVRTENFNKIKQIFRANKDRSKYFNPLHFHIAVHIRRPNSHDCRVGGTDSPDNMYLEIIRKLRTRHLSQCPLFHIYSQGDPAIFKSIYEASDVVFHLNESIEDTFTSMVLADALVLGTSCLSYSAGLLSDGIIYYVPFSHPPLSTWFNACTL